MTGLSPRTVGRHTSSGELVSSKVGGRRLIARCDLKDFMNRRRSASGGGRTPVRAHERPAAGHRAGDGEGGGSRGPAGGGEER